MPVGVHPATGIRLSAYDDAVPHVATNLTLAERFASLRQQRRGVDITQVRDVVAVVSSSRGGSTMLGELLRHCDAVLSLPGEMNPYVAVAQLGEDQRQVLAGELAREI